MCGIVGYVGGKPALDVVMEGLRRLEYRGYDSAGVAVLTDAGLDGRKKAGKLANLEKELTDQLGYIAEWDGQLVFPLPVLHTAAVTNPAALRRKSS